MGGQRKGGPGVGERVGGVESGRRWRRGVDSEGGGGDDWEEVRRRRASQLVIYNKLMYKGNL